MHRRTAALIGLLVAAPLSMVSASPRSQDPAEAPRATSQSPAPPGGPEESLREGRRAFLRARLSVAEGNYREALELYRKVLVHLPGDPIVRLEYAQLLKDLNVPEEATTQAREAVRLDPRMPEARRLLGSLELAASEKDQSRLDAAILELSEAAKLAPDDPGTIVTLARALMARGRAAEASRVLDRLPEGRSQPGLLRLTAETRAKSGRLREAEETYRALLARDPQDRDSIAALVDLYEDADRFDEALELLRRLEKQDPENTAVSERITLDLARAGRFEEAEKRARDLAGRRPENRAIRRLLAQVLFERGSIADGEKILLALLQADPGDEATRRAYAMELLRERRLDEAARILTESVQRAGQDPKAVESRRSATVELGYLALLRRDYGEAKRLLEPLAVSEGAVNGRALRILLAAARDGETPAVGLTAARAAAAAEPDEVEWTASVAEFQHRSGDKKAAEATLERLAGSSEPEDVLAAADAYSRLKEFSRASRVAEGASRRFPESTEALFRLGASLERGGSPAEAEKVFRQLLSARPNDSAAQNYLGYMWADRGVKLEEARQLLEKAVAREPRNAAYLDSLGWVYFRQGKLEAAEKRLLEAHRREPDDPTIEEHLGDLFERQGDLDKAVVHWERALALKHEEPEKVREKLARSREKLARSRALSSKKEDVAPRRDP
ncbi:MAG: tetratricopeptide repeat protein [Thermoanaerobaculia bacterium]